jgi:uncharacterized membrane protein YgcG
MSSNETPPQPPAKENDIDGRTTRSQLWGSRAQVAGTAIAALAFIVAIWTAYQGQQAIRTSAQSVERQSEDSQLSAGVAAIQSGSSQGATLGVMLLGENAVDRITHQSETGESGTEVYNDYNTALQFVATYLDGNRQASIGCPEPSASSGCHGIGYGVPVPDIDSIDAADQLQALLSSKLEDQVTALHAGKPSRLDLSGDELATQPWPWVDFGWMPATLAGADLRAADLAHSTWSGTSDLAHAYLQCADLQDANFQGATLTYADLRGADVQGANFRGAHLIGARLSPVYGVAVWPQSGPTVTAQPVKAWNQTACLANDTFWDNQQTRGGTTGPLGTGSGGTGSSSTGSGGTGSSSTGSSSTGSGGTGSGGTGSGR